jgi:hypothetical protein
MGFWDQRGMYDFKNPIIGALDTIIWLGTHYKLFFVSACRPAHYESKALRLATLFPGVELISARSKEMVKIDYLIDDRPMNCLNYIDAWPKSKTVQFRGVLKNMKKIIDERVIVCDSWKDVKKFFEVELVGMENPCCDIHWGYVGDEDASAKASSFLDEVNSKMFKTTHKYTDKGVTWTYGPHNTPYP